MGDDRQTIEAPTQTSPKDDEFVIHVMPKEFLGKPAAVVQPIVAQAPVKKALPPSPVVAPSTAPMALLPKGTVPMPAKKRHLPWALIVLLFGLLVVVGGGIVYYYFFLVTPEPEVVPEEETPIVEEPVAIQPGHDTDSDGLTDTEELLYGTDYRNPDTDGDTFLDGNEVFHRYDPLGFAPSTLLDTGSVLEFTTYELPLGGFRIYYPASWSIVNSSQTTITFHTEKTEVVTLERFPKTEDSFGSWYANRPVEAAPFSSLMAFTTKEGLDGYMQGDERLAYIDLSDAVWKFSYDLGDEVTIDYLQTFQMMINSFILVK
ncbi:MAG: hypothetical protein WC730_01195 [Patescibacteria group bacterium]|jgi:hypothetical protein